MYDKEDAMTSSVKLDLFEYSSQHWKWQQQTCQSYESICYEAQWVVNYNSYLGVYTTISSGMISTSSEEASQVFALVVNQSVVPYYCYAKESISTFHWHASEFQVIIPRDWMIGVIVTSVLTALFVLMSVVYFVVWCYRRRRTNRKSKRSINGDSSEKQPLNVENGRKTPSSSASGKKKATTATKKTNSAVGIVRTTRVSLPQQQQQIPATSNVMVPPANTQYCYYTTSSTVVGNNYNNTDQGTVVYYNSGNNVVNHAQSSGANNQQQQPQQPQSMYTK
nr:unnamed protein product [Naegleria fowleri]